MRSILHLSLAIIIVCGLVILGSMGLVRSRNRNRAATFPIVHALEQLAAVADSVIAPVASAEQWRDGCRRQLERLRSGEMPVDSARAFFHAYADCARDGIMDTEEIATLGIYVGIAASAPLQPVTESADSSDSVDSR